MQLPIAIYEAAKEQNPAKAQRLIKNLDAKFLHILAELILNVTAGHPELECALSNLIIQDLDVLSRQQDQVFINKVLLPLFKNERTLPITLTHKTENHSDLHVQPVAAAVEAAGFVASDLLDYTMLQDFATALKQVGAEKYTQSGKWTKTFEYHEKEITIQQFETMVEATKAKGPLLLLLKCKEAEGDQTQLTFGTFIKN